MNFIFWLLIRFFRFYPAVRREISLLRNWRTSLRWGGDPSFENWTTRDFLRIGCTSKWTVCVLPLLYTWNDVSTLKINLSATPFCSLNNPFSAILKLFPGVYNSVLDRRIEFLRLCRNASLTQVNLSEEGSVRFLSPFSLNFRNHVWVSFLFFGVQNLHFLRNCLLNCHSRFSFCKF